MADTVTSTTNAIALELGNAAQILHCDHVHPIQPPHGSLSRPGDCQHCGTGYDQGEYVSDGHIRRQLADLFEHAAAEATTFNAREREICRDDGRRRRYVFQTGAPDDDPDMVMTTILKLARNVAGEPF